MRTVWLLTLAGAVLVVGAAALFNLGSGPGAFWGFLGLGLLGILVWVVALVVLCLRGR